ncbi:hypothetical protein RUM44_008757 [Polyplax serrata]|uniref:Telomerase-binding protein EST1A n=1 Tax=Polyplax serrata TaxID=468196 RepID=A0ABR1B958_POLSC
MNNAAGDESCANSSKPGGRKSGDKPQIELYRPQTGMTLRRADDQLWRNSKSPSPCPADSFNKNCQVNQVHGKSKTFNKKFDSRNSAESLHRSEQNIAKNSNDISYDLRSLSISVENGRDEVINLTSRSSEDKKKIRKPEKAIYVPKPVLQTEKDGRSQQRKQKPADIKSEEDDWDENPKGSGNEHKKKRKGKGRGRPREGREMDDKEFSQSYKTDNPRRQFEGGSVQKQVSLESGRFQREQKHDKRNFNHKRRDGNRSNLRKSNDALDYSSRADSPEFSRGQQNFNVKTDKRDFRQNSEPRIIPHAVNVRPNINNSSNNRLRDTRSMEHSNWSSDKIQSKPPAGRRGSGSVSISKQATFDSLPPRLKKKYMEEKGMTVSLPPNSYIGTSSEEQWDGGSLSFLNNSSSNYMVQQYHMPTSNYQHFQNYVPQQWGMASPKGRGRGRIRQEEMESDMQVIDQNKVGQSDYQSPSGSRCTTPFKNVSQSHENISQDRSMPPPSSLPPRSFSSHDQVGPYEDRYYDYDSQANIRYSRDGRKGNYGQWKESKTLPRRNHCGRNSFSDKHQRTRKLSNTSSISNVDLDIKDMKNIPEPHPDNSLAASEGNAVPTQKCTSPRTLDWSEEVEESERQEREAISRSSSVASLSNIHSSREKRKQKRRGGKKDRSLSRESGRGYRNSSQERFRNQRRQSDENVYRPVSRDQNKGHYRFHRNLSRESSRDREPKSEILDWRRGGDQEKNDKDWRRGDAEKMDKDWRKEKERQRNDEKDEKGSWREEKKKEGPTHFDPSVPPPNVQQSPDYQQRGFIQLQQPPTGQHPQRQLFDPSNPSKPIIVNSLNSRVANTVKHGYQEKPQRFLPLPQYSPYHFQNGSLGDCVPNAYHKDTSSNRPPWYDHTNESFRTHRNPILLLDIERADTDMQYILRHSKGPVLLTQWQGINVIRQFLQESLQILLITEIKFCQEENVEQHMWKITYYNLIETLRKLMVEDPKNKEGYKNALLTIIDEGVKYFERLIQLLEENYNFKVETFLALNGGASTKGLGYTGLALVSTQKIMLFLGDLARYREVANDSSNYGKSKQWYTKAQQLNPKNGRPYYQLALLAYLARRKLDAVYYYMRSLMASNPLQSAKESLVSLFDENRKKYEQIEKKKREDRELKYKERVKEKEGSSLRREIWVHPSGRRRVHRTTSTSTDSRRADSEDEELLTLDSTDINKRFTTSYLHVHGKLFTKVGMETFQDAGLQMLREFRALLQQTPLPLGCTRFLQLLALNMFAIENTQLKGPSFVDLDLLKN